MTRTLRELLLLTLICAVAFSMALVFDYVTAVVAFAALGTASTAMALRLVLER